MAEEVDHLLGAGQPAQVAVDDDAFEAVVYKEEQVAKELGEKGFLYIDRGSGRMVTILGYPADRIAELG